MTPSERKARAIGSILQAIALGTLLFLAVARLVAVLGHDVVFRYQGF